MIKTDQGLVKVVAGHDDPGSPVPNGSGPPALNPGLRGVLRLRFGCIHFGEACIPPSMFPMDAREDRAFARRQNRLNCWPCSFVHMHASRVADASGVVAWRFRVVEFSFCVITIVHAFCAFSHLAQGTAPARLVSCRIFLSWFVG